MVNDENRIGRNVRLLREINRDTREELATKLKISKETLKAFESGKRFIHDEYIALIAKEYNVSFNMVKEQDLTPDLMESYYDKVNTEHYKKSLDLLFQTKTTGEFDKPSESFTKAEEYFRRISAFDFMETMPMVCRQLYYRSFQEDGVYAGAVNTLMMLFFEYSQLDLSPKAVSAANEGKITNGEVYLEAKRIYSEPSDNKKKFLEETKPIFNECMMALCNNDNGRIYAEYYMALKYIFGMADTKHPFRAKLEIGLVMMREFSAMGNPFAKKCVDFFGID